MAEPRKNFQQVVRGQTQTPGGSHELVQLLMKLEQALQDAQQAREELASVKRVKDRFMAALSHELRTPLTPILIAVQALEKNQDLPQPARDALEMIRRSVKIEANLINDLLDLTRVSRGKLEIDSEPMDLHAAIMGAVEISEGEFHSKNQRLTVALEAPRHRTQGDFARLQRAVAHLLKNASKFTHEGGEISVRSRIENGRFVVAVVDNGIGIEPSVLPAIFQALGQIDEGITREFGRLGLGLALSKATIEAHGGTITAESVGRDHGSTFTVELPLA
ncbi:MAG: HAMP domain-containing sensor histidine kinase [Burkholderiaceae bacterium]